MPSEKPQRKFALTKGLTGGGDWLLPSNDATCVYRLRRYEDGPSHGVETMSSDRMFWGVWVWDEPIIQGRAVDLEAWDRWEFCEGFLDTRDEAIRAALRLGGDRG